MTGRFGTANARDFHERIGWISQAHSTKPPRRYMQRFEEIVGQVSCETPIRKLLFTAQGNGLRQATLEATYL